jgi:hypothetical protein
VLWCLHAGQSSISAPCPGLPAALRLSLYRVEGFLGGITLPSFNFCPLYFFICSIYSNGWKKREVLASQQKI